MLSNPTFLLLITFGMGVVFHHVLSKRVRDFITPWLLAYMFMVMLVGSTSGGVSHFFLTAFNFVIVMVLCDGCNAEGMRYNQTWGAFLVFYGYIILACILFGYHPYDSVIDCLRNLLQGFVVGYYLSLWLCRTEGGLRKLLFAMTCSAAVTALYSIAHGGFSSNFDAHGRMALDAATFDDDYSLNQNSMAAFMSCYLPFLVLALFQVARSSQERLVKLATIPITMLICLLMVRSGSRAAGVALLPCIWYFMKSTRNRMVRGRRIAMMIVLGIAMAAGIAYTMRDAGRLRAFDFLNKNEEVGDDRINRISTGRWGMYERIIGEMTPMQKIFGRGLLSASGKYNYETSERHNASLSANEHSGYVSIFVRSGFVGVFLFVIFVVTFFSAARRCGDRGRLAIFLFMMWAVGCIGESWGMNGGRTAILAGMGIGLVTRRRIVNTELWDASLRANPVMPYNPQYPIYMR